MCLYDVRCEKCGFKPSPQEPIKTTKDSVTYKTISSVCPKCGGLRNPMEIKAGD